MIVMQRITPITADSIANGIPDTSNQIIFSNSDPAPPPYTTSLPKGKKLIPANLKHCIPTGIPIIVIHHKQPTKAQLSPPTKPPNINHKILPKHPI